MKKIKAIILAFFFLTAGAVTSFAACGDSITGGIGTSGDPYQIDTPGELAAISNCLGSGNSSKYFKLMTDIDINVSPYNTGSGWTPIGTGSGSNGFYGKFNGSGYTISNLFIYTPSTSNRGLFGYIETGGLVENTLLTNVNVDGGSIYIGSIAGYNGGTVQNVGVSNGTVKGLMRFGGLVGYNAGTTQRSYSVGVTVTQKAASIDCCVGGLIGGNESGGIALNLYSRNPIVHTSSGQGSFGGVIGNTYTSGTMNYLYSTAGITSLSSLPANIGGLIGNNYVSASNSYWDTQSSGLNSSGSGTGKNTSQMKDQSTYSGWDFSTIWTIDPGINDGYPFFQWQAIPPSAAPSVQASAFATTSINYNRISLSWTNGDGNRRIVLAKQASSGTASPADNTVYGANTTFGSGTQIGSTGWYAVYNGMGNSVTVTDLTAETDYIFQVFEYNGSGSYALYATSTSNQNTLVQTTTAIAIPTTQASQLSFSNTGATQVTLSWTTGDGDSRVVFAKQSNSGTTAPVNSTTYTANSIFGSGTQIGSTGWFTVYSGTGTSTTVSGLIAETDYIFQVFEYNGGSSNELYNTSTSANNPNSISTITTPIGDDFESGTLTYLNWQFSGNLPWTITSADKYSGTYSARAGAITHNQSSSIEVTVNVPVSGNVTYYRKVTSESCCDFLRFYIDGVQKESISGSGSWGQATFAVTSGSHVFKWTYSKDGSVSTGADTGWIDNIVFPQAPIVQYTLSYVAGSGGTLSGSTTQTITSGRNGTQVTAVPNTGFSFTNWSDGATTTSRTDTNITATSSYTAYFATSTYTLTYSAATGGSLTGSTTQIVNHSSSGTSISAVPESGYVFAGWSDGSTDNPRTDLSVVSNKSVTALFNDSDAPVISNISTSTTDYTAVISWVTDEPSSSFVTFSPDESFNGISSTSTLSTSHTITLSNLIPCSVYYYKVGSTDSTGNSAAGIPATFRTVGCTSNTTILTSGIGNISISHGGSLTQNTLSLVVPTSFTTSTSSVVFQANKLDHSTFFQNTGTPAGLTQTSSSVYNLKAFSDATTTISSFDEPLIVTIAYTDQDIVGISESSLWIYRYDGNSWHALETCTINFNSKEVTCYTSAFSDFTLFGQVSQSPPTPSAPPAQITSVSSHSGTSIQGRVNNLVTMGNIAQAQELIQAWPQLFTQPTTTPILYQETSKKDILFTRDLYLGVRDSEVKKLQIFLNKQNYLVSSNGPGSPGNETDFFGSLTKKALITFQRNNSILPSVGFFGPVTRKYIENMQ